MTCAIPVPGRFRSAWYATSASAVAEAASARVGAVCSRAMVFTTSRTASSSCCRRSATSASRSSSSIWSLPASRSWTVSRGASRRTVSTFVTYTVSLTGPGATVVAGLAHAPASHASMTTAPFRRTAAP